MQIGVSGTDVTPPVGTPMGGLRTWRFANGTHDPLRATAMVLASGDETVALCSCDVIWLTNDAVAAIRERVARRTDIDPGAVVVGATHTHSGPAMAPMIYPNVPDPEYEQELIERAAATVVAAAEDRRPARVRAGTADESDLLENRRAEYRAQRDPTDRDDLLRQLETGERTGPENVDESRVEAERREVDGEVGVLHAESAAGDPVGTLVSFACHPTNVDGGLGDRYSGDYVGVLREELRGAFGGDHRTVFGLGACGELRPADQTEGFGPPTDVGEALAGDAVGVREESDAGTPAVAWASETLDLERRQPTDDHLDAAREYLDAHAGTENDRALWAAHETLRLADAPDSHAVEVWAGRVGETALLALPGEVFHEHGLAIKRRSPFERTLLLTLAPGYCGYVPTGAAFERGGYEVTLAASSFLARDAGERMVEAAADLLAAL